MDEKRLKILLYNAIVWMDEECGGSFEEGDMDKYKWLEDTIGITKEELKDIEFI